MPGLKGMNLVCLIPKMLHDYLSVKPLLSEKGKKKVRQEANSIGVWKQKALFILSTLQLKQIRNKLKQGLSHSHFQ